MGKIPATYRGVDGDGGSGSDGAVVSGGRGSRRRSPAGADGRGQLGGRLGGARGGPRRAVGRQWRGGGSGAPASNSGEREGSAEGRGGETGRGGVFIGGTSTWTRGRSGRGDREEIPEISGFRRGGAVALAWGGRRWWGPVSARGGERGVGRATDAEGFRARGGLGCSGAGLLGRLVGSVGWAGRSVGWLGRLGAGWAGWPGWRLGPFFSYFLLNGEG